MTPSSVPTCRPRRLPERPRARRGGFERDLTQSEIADVLGLSQLQVSRILRKALERLRRLAARPLHV